MPIAYPRFEYTPGSAFFTLRIRRTFRAVVYVSLAIVATVTAVHAQPSTGVDPDRPAFYAVVHMANSAEIVEWALESGANAIEADLRFDARGRPLEFHHGAPCDCSCKPAEICKRFSREVCNETTPAEELLSMLASQRSLALVFIDGKIDEMTPLEPAGRHTIVAIDEQLIQKGYKGNVVLSTKEFASEEFLRAAAMEIDARGLSSRVMLTFGGEGNNVEEAIERLIALPTALRAVGAGSSACWIGPYKPAIRRAEEKRRAGVISLTYIWTIDRRAAMNRYIDLGVGAIITNNPRRLSDLLEKKRIGQATPGTRPPTATSDQIVTGTR